MNDRAHWKAMLPIIQAFVDGKEVEFNTGVNWEPIDYPPFNSLSEYRIKPKPKPKPDVVMYARVHEPRKGNIAAYITNAFVNAEAVGQPNLRIYYCGETGKLKKAEVIE